ncbi:hypothetical protein VE25_04435 [Devosia geojensis]|uniref:Uncharacterized protein n=1 Tax=Devosia geojensis TaxID=443610 RepID=A0A0F5FVR4_9HYPH|nr:hypothetical protein [Devosia geojensis]KKB12954.1 hypothetical protein VE25_04435 [Devosia geojensis]
MQRQILRTMHVLLGLALGALVYLPASWSVELKAGLAWFGLPAAIITGLLLWQQGRLRRWLGRATQEQQ